MKKGAIVTIGSFDGVHRGHMALLKKTCEEANKRKKTALGLTFKIPPKVVLKKEKGPFLLSTPDEKKWLVKSLGIDHLDFYDFNRQSSRTHPHHFFKNILIDKYNVSGVVVGHDFRFGVNRSAGAVDLVRWGVEHNIRIWIIGPVKAGSLIISSSQIRAFLLKSNINKAQQLLGHPYLIIGPVVRGLGLGQTLGFPTVNIQPQPNKIYPRGVYAVRGWVGNGQRKFKGVCNIGFRPTVSNTGKLSIETHVLGKTPVFGKQKVSIELLKKMRDEKRFKSQKALIHAISGDVEKANIFFKKRH